MHVMSDSVECRGLVMGGSAGGRPEQTNLWRRDTRVPRFVRSGRVRRAEALKMPRAARRGG